MSPKPRVVVAMSGGVDSSVAAALLAQQGYQVIGVMLRLWSEAGEEAANRCCTPDAMAQAKRVASILKIPFYAVDAKQAFYEKVVRSFIGGYAQGITPNPCLCCNRFIRWGVLLEYALALGAELMATGHYARLQIENDGGKFQLLRAVDRNKDQSYILSMLNQEQLQHSLFPLGEFTKPQVRELARQLDLPVAERSDSQDLCFLGDGSLADFLLRNAPEVENPGVITSSDGLQIGTHKGLAFYTIGQRKGLSLNSPHPLYVLEKDLQRNALVVGPQEALGRQELIAGDVNWVSGEAPASPLRVQAKIRYKAQEAPGLLTTLEGSRLHVQFDERLRDITAGQAIVFYKDEICLGGGIIQQPERKIL